MGDGFCDDDTNTGDCEFDGGDCCGDDINTDYCEDCKCKQFNMLDSLNISAKYFLLNSTKLSFCLFLKNVLLQF